MKALWKGTLIAESNETIVVEGNHYFPADSIKQEYFKASETQTKCIWKGTASYYHIEVSGDINADAAWYYPDPKLPAKKIKDYVAFWKGVEISE